MNSVTVGRIVLLLVVVSLVYGGYNLYQGKNKPGQTPGLSFSFPNLFGHSTQTQTPTSGSSDVTVLTTGTKAQWLDDEIAAFNGQYPQYHVTRLPLLESRDGMHAILEGRVKPTIWSPSGQVWIARLDGVWAQQNQGQQIADMDDPQDFRTLLKSPLVIMTTKDKAPYFQQVFNGQSPWNTIRELSIGGQRTPWGSFKFGHADPLDASSGMLTMSLIIQEYARRTGQEGSLSKMAESEGFAGFLTDLEHSAVYDPAATGSSALERAFEDDPSSRDFITAYESKALAACTKYSNLAVVYPNPTSVGDQPAAVLNASWVTQDQRDAAHAFLQFLASAPAIQNATKYYFRPAISTDEVSLASQISQYSNNGFQQSYSSIELPPYDALNEAANVYRVYVKNKK